MGERQQGNEVQRLRALCDESAVEIKELKEQLRHSNREIERLEAIVEQLQNQLAKVALQRRQKDLGA